MPTLITWGDILQSSLENVWLGFAAFLPKLIGAIVVFLIGVIVAAALKNFIVRLSGWLKLDILAEKLDLKGSLIKIGITLKVGELLGWIVRWFVIVAFLIAAADILNWPEITSFLTQIVLYIPNVLIAVVILLAGVMLANFVRNVIHQAVRAAGLGAVDFVAGIARWAIFLFALMAALVQLQIAEQLINMLFAGLVGMLAIAGGLAFGLGGRDQATRFIEKLRKEISSEHH